MEILLTNDDGVRAPGLHVMAEILRRFGRVVVCSPDRERSACGHSMTLRDPLRATPVEDFPVEVETYEVNGVPVDCVNLALHEFFPSGCDLVVSGINAGPNLGWDVTYSGTVGGALEGAVNGIRSIAVSVAVFVEEAPPNLETARLWLEEYLPWLLAAPQPKHTIFNVNLPSIAYPEIRGTRITRMGTRIYEERVERREDPFGRPYWWQGGVVVMDSSEEGTDVQAVNQGFVSVTPVLLDWTAHDLLPALRESLERAK